MGQYLFFVFPVIQTVTDPTGAESWDPTQPRHRLLFERLRDFPLTPHRKILTGLATNVCVESTARDGFMRDYQIIIPEDMTEGTSLEAKKWSLFNINTFFGEVVNSNNLLSIWGVKD